MSRYTASGRALESTLHAFQLSAWDPAQEPKALLAQLRGMPGVRRVEFNSESGRLMVLGGVHADDVVQLIKEYGMNVKDEAEAREDDLATRPPTTRPRRWRIPWQYALVPAAALASFLIGILASVAVTLPLAQLILWGSIGITVIVALSFKTVRHTLAALMPGRLDTNVLMVVIAIASAIRGAWVEGALTVVLFVLMQVLPSAIFSRIERRIKRPIETLPEEAIRLAETGQYEHTPVDEVAIGDTIHVAAGQVVPLDGTVTHGSATVDVHVLTGERIPFVVADGDPIYAGAQLIDGTLEMYVEQPAQRGMLHRIRSGDVLKEAQTSALSGWMGILTERFTSIVVFLAFAVMLIPPLFMSEAIEPWLGRALLLLVVAPTNALVIATVAPLIGARTRAAELGTLCGSPTVLSRLGRAVRFVFTLSPLVDGRHTVTHIEPFADLSSEKALQLAASLAGTNTRQPLSAAMQEAAEAHGITLLNPVQSEGVPSYGIKGTLRVEGFLQELRIGNTVWMRQEDITLPDSIEDWLESVAREGGQVVWLADNVNVLAAIVVARRLRDGSRRMVERLKRSGIKSMAIITADDPDNAHPIGGQAGIDEVYAGLTPEEQSDAIENWLRAGESVASIGTVFDHPAPLVASDVHLWIGSDGAAPLDQNGLVFADQDTPKLLSLINLARRLNRVAKQSISMALLAKVVFLSAALSGSVAVWHLVVAEVGVAIALLALGLRLLWHRR